VTTDTPAAAKNAARGGKEDPQAYCQQERRSEDHAEETQEDVKGTLDPCGQHGSSSSFQGRSHV
jgi:hypothetical protein